MPLLRNKSEAQKRRLLRSWLLVGCIVALALGIVALLGLFHRSGGTISGKKLRCVVSQSVTPFDDRILYYENGTLFCLSSAGRELWSASVGEGAQFHAGEKQVVVWSGSQIMVFDKNGRSSYSDRLLSDVQFARAGSKYIAVVTGEKTSPLLSIYSMDGQHIDDESNDYSDLVLLDCGFFGDGEYLWSTSLDVYGAVAETTLRIYRVKQMNTGSVSLGEPITYSVLYSGGYLNVVNTRQLRLYDYRGTENTDASVLVYGWQLISASATSSDPYLLFAPSLQTDSGSFTELRLLHGKTDMRYSLPDVCVGAAIRNKRIYAFSGNSLYRADIQAQRFSALHLPVDGVVSDFLGVTSNGTALLACGSEVWAVSLP